MAFCSKCGASLAEGAGFCSGCGSKVGSEGVSANSSNAGEGAAKKTFGEKAKGGINKLPFRNMAEKIPAETRAKIPLLNTLIPLANYIVLGAAALVLVIAIGGGGGGSSGVVYKDFFGTWVGTTYTFIISENEIIMYTTGYKDSTTNILTITDVTPMTNTENNRANYPNGFRFSLSYTDFDSKFRNAEFTFFLHTSKKEFSYNSQIYRKQ